MAPGVQCNVRPLPVPRARSSRKLPTPALAAVAPAKVNLGLHILRRRPDGYHDIETVLLPFGWADRLAAAPADGLSLTCSDPALPTDDGNLVVRAAKALAAWAGVAPRAALHLDKRVPYGAGLGSGSSDAAAALRLLAALWGLDVPGAVLHALAATLGSDVPFFLLDGPALATGRGEVLTPLRAVDGAPYRLPFALVVAVAPVHVATAGAYGLVTPDDRGRPDLAVAVRSNDLDRWRRELVNDFEGPVLARYPEVGAAKARLLSEGAGYAALSGSGAAVFGVFDGAGRAASAAEAMRAGGCRVWVEPESLWRRGGITAGA
jgi:4-diphosphocytidyl-2-C-methyl-D-erythritol kinase